MSSNATTPPAGVAIEPATPDDRLDVLRVLDAAMLETDPDVVDAALSVDDAGDAERALVARFARTDAVVGALVAASPEPGRLHVDAVAVRRARRGRGIGSALVAEAVRRAESDTDIDAVTAAFEPRLEGFYTDLGFEIGADAGVEAADCGAESDNVGDTDHDDEGGAADDADRDAAADADRLFGRYRV